jgi:hypothetical protein
MKKRSLVLRSETLSELRTAELAGVVGGDDTRHCATRDCYTAAFTCFLSEHVVCEPPQVSGWVCP